MTCDGFQYEEGKEYEETDVCRPGFRACENPLNCFYGSHPNQSVYHEVEQSGDISKPSRYIMERTSSKIKIGRRLSIAELAKEAVEYIKGKTGLETSSNEDGGVSSATGYGTAFSVTGKYSISSTAGYKGASSAENPGSVAVAWGRLGRAKGVIGSFLVLAGFANVPAWAQDQDEWKLKGAKMVQVDGEKIKEDTWYTLINGEIVEAED